MTSKDNNNKSKLEEETKCLVVRKRLWLFDDYGGDYDSSES
jgi:hypothetical protein